MTSQTAIRPAPETSEDSLGARLRRLRSRLGLSQQDLAAAIGEQTGSAVQASTVSRWEKGRSLPAYDNLLALYNFAARRGVDPKLFPLAGFQGQGLAHMVGDSGVTNGELLTVRTVAGPGVMAKVLAALVEAKVDVHTLTAKQLSDGTGVIEVLIDLDGSEAEPLAAVTSLNAIRDVVLKVEYEPVHRRVAAAVG